MIVVPLMAKMPLFVTSRSPYTITSVLIVMVELMTKVSFTTHTDSPSKTTHSAISEGFGNLQTIQTKSKQMTQYLELRYVQVSQLSPE